MKLEKNTSNTVILTLDEKSTSATHDWLFEFTSAQNGTVKYCIGTDVSSYTERYNKFTITESSTESPYNATLEFHTGTWYLKVYEMPTASPPSLTPTGYLAIVHEDELVKVVDPNAPEDSNFNAENTKSNKTFRE